MGIVEISSKEDLRKKLKEENRTVIVGFWSKTNGPCRVMAPVLEFFYGQHSDKVTILKVDIDQFPELVEEYNIQTLPTMVIYRDGIISEKRILGSMPASVMADSIFEEAS